MKQLIELDFEVKKKRYPNMPEHCIPKLKAKQNANGLTQSIIKFLTLKGHFATRTSSAGRYLTKEKKWIPGTTRKGFPDVTGTINGKSIFVEIKVGKDRMSEAQLKVKREIEMAGGVYYIAKSFDEFGKWYDENFKT